VEAVTYLDTHVALWLYAGNLNLLSPKARTRVERDTLLVSPAVTLELQFLHEIGRVKVGAQAVLAPLESALGLGICNLPFEQVVEMAKDQAWTRDPFDRLIVGQAAARGAALLTRDETIRAHYGKAVW
jgi:PIN domain nuclease of toxin-antitoxin system